MADSKDTPEEPKAAEAAEAAKATIAAIEGGEAEFSDARQIVDEQIKAQLEVSRHFRLACGKVSEKLFSELKVRLTEAPTPDEDGQFEANATLAAEDGKAIAECRVFTGLNGVTYFVAGKAAPKALEATTPEHLEQTLAEFSERALKRA
ncbi:MAG: hypothetical protein JNJ73_01715 [Hyphomonadaceae bacterium]|nr:hypothetical protein [Hyphomonadaceae bacterium]